MTRTLWQIHLLLLKLTLVELHYRNCITSKALVSVPCSVVMSSLPLLQKFICSHNYRWSNLVKSLHRQTLMCKITDGHWSNLYTDKRWCAKSSFSILQSALESLQESSPGDSELKIQFQKAFEKVLLDIHTVVDSPHMRKDKRADIMALCENAQDLMKDILDKYNKNIKVIICSYDLNLNLSWEITGCVSSNSFTAFYTKSKNHLGRTSGFRKPVCCSRLSETQEVETGTQWNNHILCCVGPLTVFPSFAVQQNDNSSGDSLQLAVQRISKNSKELQQEVEGIFNTEWLSRFVVVGETNQGHVNLILQGWQA